MSRLYIRVLTGFYSHRKTIRLLQKIGEAAFWIPPRLWAYAAENQPDGDMSGYGPDELSMLIGYKGDASSMLQALKDCGFMDLDGMIHDWLEHNGYHKKFSIRAKKAAKARWSKPPPQTPPEVPSTEKKKEESGDKHCLSNATSISGSESTKAKGTKEEVLLYVKELSLPETDGEWFFDKCEGCGWKNGKNAIKDWRATIRSWKAGGYFPSQKQTERNNGKHFVTPQQQKEAIREQIEAHPCNKNSIHHTGNETQTQFDEFRNLKKRLATITAIIANGGKRE